MFLKIDKAKNGKVYFRIAESYRNEHGKPRNRTIFNLGVADKLDHNKLCSLANSIIKACQHSSDSIKSNTHELGRFNYGLPLVIDHILNEIGLKSLFNKMSENKISIDIYKTILLMLMERINNPSSKFQNCINQRKYINYKDNTINLQHLYRTLDELDISSSKIKDTLFKTSINRLNLSVDAVFYDVTTLYFDSSVENKNTLRQKGYSKDNKIGKTQVVLGILIDKNQIPIDYFLLPGNTYEGHTLGEALYTLKKRYNIQKSIIITDSGMMSAANINLIKSQSDYSYVIGERYKNLPNEIKKLYLDKSNYKSSCKVIDRSTNKSIEIRYFEYYYKKMEKRLIFTYSTKRAKKDKYEREKRIEKGYEILTNPSILERKKSRYFIKENSNKKYEIDLEKIEASSTYDGIGCISTDSKTLEVKEILENYKELYKIEQSIRSLKSFLETRPMFHWSDKRISGHMCLCFISYYIMRYLQLELKKHKNPMSEHEIRETLSEMEISYINTEGTNYYLTSKNTKKIKGIMKCTKQPNLPDMFREIELKEYINV